jgi:hypothetical protein
LTSSCVCIAFQVLLLPYPVVYLINLCSHSCFFPFTCEFVLFRSRIDFWNNAFFRNWRRPRGLEVGLCKASLPTCSNKTQSSRDILASSGNICVCNLNIT